MKKSLVFLLIAIFVTACVPKQKTRIVLHNRFEADAVAFVKGKGNNTVKGSAFLKTRGGDVKTCAGNDVVLIPVTPYSAERMQAIYGTTSHGVKGILEMSDIHFDNDDPRYQEYKINAMCNQHGDFVFTQVPNGEYFLITSVYWEVPMQYANSFQGGGLMRKISVEGGGSQEIILSR